MSRFKPSQDFKQMCGVWTANQNQEKTVEKQKKEDITKKNSENVWN